jgi:hypothetical protein
LRGSDTDPRCDCCLCRSSVAGFTPGSDDRSALRMNLPLGISRLVDWRWHAGQKPTALIPTLLTEVRHEMVVKAPKSFKISLGCREVCTTF